MSIVIRGKLRIKLFPPNAVKPVENWQTTRNYLGRRKQLRAICNTQETRPGSQEGKRLSARKKSIKPWEHAGGWLKETKQKLMTVELQKNSHTRVSFRESIGGVLVAITPDLTGIALQPQGTKPDSLGSPYDTFSTSTTASNILSITPAHCKSVAGVLFSKIQSQPQFTFYQGGLLRNSQNVQPRYFLQCGSRRESAGAQSTLFQLIGGNK